VRRAPAVVNRTLANVFADQAAGDTVQPGAILAACVRGRLQFHRLESPQALRRANLVVVLLTLARASGLRIRRRRKLGAEDLLARASRKGAVRSADVFAACDKAVVALERADRASPALARVFRAAVRVFDVEPGGARISDAGPAGECPVDAAHVLSRGSEPFGTAVSADSADGAFARLRRVFDGEPTGA